MVEKRLLKRTGKRRSAIYAALRRADERRRGLTKTDTEFLRRLGKSVRQRERAEVAAMRRGDRILVRGTTAHDGLYEVRDLAHNAAEPERFDFDHIGPYRVSTVRTPVVLGAEVTIGYETLVFDTYGNEVERRRCRDNQSAARAQHEAMCALTRTLDGFEERKSRKRKSVKSRVKKTKIEIDFTLRRIRVRRPDGKD